MIGAPTYLPSSRDHDNSLLPNRLKFVAFDASKVVKEALGRINFKIGLNCSITGDNFGQATLREESETSAEIVQANAEHFNRHQLE